MTWFWVIYLGIGAGLVYPVVPYVNEIEAPTFNKVLGVILFVLIWPIAFFIDES